MTTPTLSPLHRSRIKLWVEALRSGKYEQARGSMRDGDKFCCLGVANCIFKEQTGIGLWLDGTFTAEGSTSVTALPPPVLQWFGFSEGNPYLPGPEHQSNCIDQNDRHKAAFPQIADLIEKTYLKEAEAQ